MTRAPIDMKKTPFQPVTNTLFPSAKPPDSLLSIYVSMEPSPEITDYIIPRIHINGIYFISVMCS